MLSTSYAMYHSSSAMPAVLGIVALLVVIDIILFIYSIYCLFDCVHNNALSSPMAILLGILLFAPGLGFIDAVGIVIYHSIYCKKRPVGAQFKFY